MKLKIKIPKPSPCGMPAYSRNQKVPKLPKGQKAILLTKGKFAIVDASLFKELNKFSWYASKGKNGNYYAYREKIKNWKKKAYAMHRVITGAKKGQVVDHQNGNGLLNTKENLRVCTNRQNCMNRCKNVKNKNPYKGVSWAKNKNRWRARIMLNKKEIHVLTSRDPIACAKAYNEKAKELFGEFAFLNKV